MATKVYDGGKSAGDKALAKVVSVGAALTTGALKKGFWYYVISKAAESSVLPVGPGYPFQSALASTLAVGDSVYPLTMGADSILGFAKDKSIGMTKSMVDLTTDDNYPNSLSEADGVTKRSGTISGNHAYPKPGSALYTFMSKFTTMSNAVSATSAQDTITVTEPDDNSVLLMLDWLAYKRGVEGLAEGDLQMVEFIPARLSNMQISASKGSAVTLSFDYEGQAEDDYGNKPMRYNGPFHVAEAE